MIRTLVAAPVAAALLGGGFLIWLRGAGYSHMLAALLSVVVLAQAGPFVAVGAGKSLWLALGVWAVVSSAAAFATRADPRRIILFGGSLAAIQLLDPLGGFLTAGLLPATLAIGHSRVDPRQTAGLYALLMFMPLMTAVLLLYLARVQHIDPAGLLAGPPAGASPRIFAAHAGLAWRLAPALGLAVIVSPVLLGLGRLRAAPARAVALVALGVAAAGAASALLGVIREPVTLLAAAAPIVAASLAQWPATPTRSRDALAAALLCTALSWGVVLSLMPQGLGGG